MADQRLTTRPDKAVAEDTDIIYIVRPSDTSADPSGTGFKMERGAFRTDLEDLGIKHVQTIAEFNTLVSGATAGKWLISSDIILSASVTIPSDVLLSFNGSKIDLNGFVLTGSNTVIEASKQAFTTNGTFAGTWGNTFVKPEWFGTTGDGTTDDTAALVNCHSLKNSVEYNSAKNYVVKSSNVIVLHDGNYYNGNKCKITVPSTATASGGTDGYGRFFSSVFYRNSTAALLQSIKISDFDINIEKDQYNFIGGLDISSLTKVNNVGFMFINNNVLVNNGTPVGLGGNLTATYQTGSFIDVIGYNLDISSNKISDCGNSIVLFNSYKCNIYDNLIEFSGVSRDYTSWVNAAAISVRGTEFINIHDNTVYVTGGTAIFTNISSSDANNITTTVSVKDNQLYGCGLTAISGGTRASAVSQLSLKAVIIEGNSVIGHTCGIDANLHSGMSIALTDGNSSTIDILKLNNFIDFLAPWETFNYSTNEVDGSYNDNKTKGFDIGSQNSLSVSADSTNGIKDAVINGTYINHSRGGVGLLNIKNAYVDVSLHNNGWSRDASDNAYQISRSFQSTTCEFVQAKLNISNQSRGVNVNATFCTPIYLEDNNKVVLDAKITDSNNQTTAIRLVNSVANYVLEIDKLIFDNPFLDVGYVNYIDISAGANTANTIIDWAGVNTAMIGGSRTLPAGHKFVGMSYTSGSPKTVTLQKAQFYKGSNIIFTADTATMTITPNGLENIDGSNSSLTLTIGQSSSLYSDGSEWFTLGL